jgi:cytochrome b
VKSKPRIVVWDPFVRLLHWSLAALVAIDLVRDDGDYPHRLVGYGAAAIVLLRLCWALLSGTHGLRPSVAETLAYLRLLSRGKPPRFLGHDPLGLWMVWLLWILVLLLGVTGWMSRLDAFWGDDLVHDVHALLANILLACVLVHVGAVVVMSWLWRENLPAAMVTGTKKGGARVASIVSNSPNRR